MCGVEQATALTMRPLVASGMGIREAGRTALATDTI